MAHLTDSIKQPGHSISTDGNVLGRRCTQASVVEGTIFTQSDETTVTPKKQYGMITIISLAFVICNSWAGISVSLQLALVTGGPATLIYSILVSTAAYICIAATLAELASVYPTTGGQYHFTSILSPRQYHRELSYACGFLAVMSWIAIGAAITITTAQGILGLAEALHPSYIAQRWHTFVVYEIIALFVVVFNIFGLKRASWSHNIGFLLTIALFFIETIGLLARASPRATDEFVWGTLINETGWPDGVCFLTGMTTSCFMYIGVDASMHVADECAEPARTVPKAIMAAILIGFTTALPFTIALLYSISDLDSILTSDGYIPFLIMQQGLRSTSFAVAIYVLGFILSWFVLNAVQETSARLSWSFARDQGFLLSNYIGQMHPRLEAPVWANIFAWLVLALCGIIYVASTTAFNAIIGSSIALQQMTFLLPAVLLLYRRRREAFLPRKRAFYLPDFLGWTANIVVVVFSTVMTVIFCLPSFLPVTGSTMNYTSVILAIAFVIGGLNWIFHARLHYHGPRIEFAT